MLAAHPDETVRGTRAPGQASNSLDQRMAYATVRRLRAKEHVLSAQATVPAKVRCLAAAALERIAETDAGLALKLYKAVCQELAATRNLLVTVGQRSAIERVAAFLISLHRRTAAEGAATINLAMRRSDIADLLGLTIETVSRTLTKLRSMGVIDLEQGATRVRLCDLPRLAELANE
jgi:CRP/FNR family transcriptional regulator